MPPGFIAQQPDHFARDGPGIAERHEHAAILGEQLRRVPVRRRDHRLARAERIRQRAGGNLRFVQIGSEVQVGHANELLQLVQLDETIVEDDVLLDFVFLGQPFEAQPVGFPLFAQQVGMGGAQHDIDDIRELRENLRQRIEHVLDPLVW